MDSDGFQMGRKPSKARSKPKKKDTIDKVADRLSNIDLGRIKFYTKRGDFKKKKKVKDDPLKKAKIVTHPPQRSDSADFYEAIDHGL